MLWIHAFLRMKYMQYFALQRNKYNEMDCGSAGRYSLNLMKPKMMRVVLSALFKHHFTRDLMSFSVGLLTWPR